MKRLQRSTVKRTLVTPGKDKQVPTKKQKRNQARQSIPEMGKGESEETLKQKQLKKICRQSRTDQAVVKSLVSSTFPLRRKSVIDGTETLEELLGNYPPLLKPVHVSNGDVTRDYRLQKSLLVFVDESIKGGFERENKGPKMLN